MDLKELSESVQQSAPVPLISPKRQIHSRFQPNLDETIESCKAQLGINEILEDVYTLLSTVIRRTFRSQIVAIVTLSVMRNRTCQKMTKTKRGL